jgi:WD40 repeat protein
MSADGSVTSIPLAGSVPSPGHTIFEAGVFLTDVAVSPSGEFFAVGHHPGEVWLGRDDGKEPRLLPGTDALGSGSVSFSLDSRFVAAGTGFYTPKKIVFRVWAVATAHEVAALSLPDDEFRGGSRFTSDGSLLAGTSKGVVAWDIESGQHEILVEADVDRFFATSDGRRLVVTEEGEGGGLQDPAGSPTFFDLDTRGATVLTSHGLQVRAMALDRHGEIVATGDTNGIIRVGPVTGEGPHLLLGHDGRILQLVIDPLSRWIASVGQDNTVRLWPMPDLSKPPLHTLPREELIAKLKTLTNLRVVRDEESVTGWKLTHDPFPGWETVPTW